jgi:pSer/pThr/pTyr-binding forkhead associated (FHA) protein
LPPSSPSPVPVNRAPVVDRSIMPDKPGYWLVIRRGPNQNMMYRLEGAVVNIGREPTNDIPIQHGEMSRHHFRLIFQGNAYAIEDLGSTNGTLVNGVRPTSIMPLIPGCTLSIGDAIVLTYEVVA